MFSLIQLKRQTLFDNSTFFFPSHLEMSNGMSVGNWEEEEEERGVFASERIYATVAQVLRHRRQRPSARVSVRVAGISCAINALALCNCRINLTSRHKTNVYRVPVITSSRWRVTSRCAGLFKVEVLGTIGQRRSGRSRCALPDEDRDTL